MMEYLDGYEEILHLRNLLATYMIKYLTVI